MRPYLLFVFCAVIPVLHDAAKRDGTRLLNAALITTAVLLPELALWAYF
jgi:hypothetical protein